VNVRGLTPNSGYSEMGKKYGFLNFAWDATLTVLTGGLWLIRVFVRETREA
jgi:hypothetical protein